jgi:hypothetical protein
MIFKNCCFIILVVLVHCKAYQEKAIELKFNPCPNFGIIENSSIPLELLEEETKNTGVTYYVHFLNYKNEYNKDEIKFFNGSKYIISAFELRQYLKSYRSICGKEFPPFYNKIPFVSKDISNIMQEKEKLIQRNIEIEKELEKLTRIKNAEGDYLEDKKEIEKLYKIVVDKMPITYTVIGKVRQREEDFVIIWGKAVPQNSKDMEQDEGVIVRDSNIRINDYKRKNILYNTQYLGYDDYFTGKRGLFTSIKKDMHPDVIRYEERNESFKSKYEGFEIGLSNYERKKEELRSNNHRLETIARLEKDLFDLIPKEMRTLDSKIMVDVPKNKINISVLADVNSDTTEARSNTGGWSKFLGSMNYNEAVTNCAELGMRLPTLEELKTGYTTKITESWKVNGFDYWSSTPKGDNYSFSFHVEDGSSDVVKNTDKNYVRCIR